VLSRWKESYHGGRHRARRPGRGGDSGRLTSARWGSRAPISKAGSSTAPPRPAGLRLRRPARPAGARPPVGMTFSPGRRRWSRRRTGSDGASIAGSTTTRRHHRDRRIAPGRLDVRDRPHRLVRDSSLSFPPDAARSGAGVASSGRAARWCVARRARPRRSTGRPA
jgi:hypothetical protein